MFYVIRQGNERVARNAISDIMGQDKSKDFSVEIKPYRRSKTNEQRAYLFGVVICMIKKHLEENGDPSNEGDIYDWFIEEYAPRVQVTLKGVTHTKKLTVSQMNVEQMSGFIERIVMHAAEYMDLYIPDPEPDRGHAK